MSTHIASEKGFYFSQKVLIFFLLLHEDVESTYEKMPCHGTSNSTHYTLSWKNKKNIYPIHLLPGAMVSLTHLCQVNSSTITLWTAPFPI